jgi:hypothetical protein
MKSVLSRHDAETALAEIRRALEDAIDSKHSVSIMPLHGKAMTPEERESLCRRLAHLKTLRDRAVALRSRIRNSRLGLKLSSWAVELRLIAERAAGDLLGRLKLAGGDRKSSQRANRLQLKTCGISPSDSYRWQREAKLPGQDFTDYLRHASLQGKEPSSDGLFRLATINVENAQFSDKNADPFCRAFAGLRCLRDENQRFGCILLDVGSVPADSGRADRLAHLPVLQVAAPKVHIYLKVAPDSLDDGRKLLAVWGFTRATLLVPAMRPLDPHGSVLAVHDMLLLGLRDELGRDGRGLPRSIEELGDFPLQPGEALHHVLERMSPPPYLDVFALQPFSAKWTMATRQRC